MDKVIGIVRDAGYKCQWKIISAHDAGAPQTRKRWFLLGYKNTPSVYNNTIINTLSYYKELWKKEPVPRLLKYIPNQYTKRLKALGNSVVPLCALLAMHSLSGKEVENISKTYATIIIKDNNGNIIKTYNKWGTPCASVTQPAHTFSSRFIGSLYTQMLYDSKSHKTSTKCHCNPEFVEWLQGYPIEWTKVDPST